MDGKDFIAKTGESITVPKGMRHIAFNNKESVLNCRVAYSPGLDYDRFMQCLLGLTKDGILAKNVDVDIPRMGYFLTKMTTRCIARPTAIPESLFKIALKVFYI